MGAKGWFAAGVIATGITYTMIGLASMPDDSPKVSATQNVNSTTTSTIENSQVKIDEWGGKWCWDAPSNQWIRACP